MRLVNCLSFKKNKKMLHKLSETEIELGLVHSKKNTWKGA